MSSQTCSLLSSMVVGGRREKKIALGAEPWLLSLASPRSKEVTSAESVTLPLLNSRTIGGKETTHHASCVADGWMARREG